MTIGVGTRVGPYEIISALGAGGMGEVYRARDTKLGRDVAIKIVPGSFAADPERLARFEREARVLASLNHPHIAQIYGLEDQAIVMELVDGEMLADRIRGGPLRVADALAIARQIADGLDAAHEKGIVHRDLKPSNIALTHDGAVKILDFGLAKDASVGVAQGVSPGSDAAGLTHSPTVMAPTMTGVLLGTAPYMSPEQARGKAVDKRTDIWAFGCVFYEMISGRRAFNGETTTDTVAAILERDPDWAALPASTPLSVVHVLKRCLEKDPKRRQRDIADARALLDDSAVGVPTATARPMRTLRVAGAVLAAIVVLLAVIGVTVYYTMRFSPSVPATRPAELTRVTFDDGYTVDPAISKDGALIAYASDRAGRNDLDVWVQQTAGSKPIRVTTDDVDEREPAFSPDASRIAFRSERGDGALYVIPTLGGEQPRFLAAGGRQPSFSPDGSSVAYWTGTNIGFSGEYDTWTVPIAGGTPQLVKGLASVRFPAWSPDGHALLVLATSTRGSRDVGAWDWWRVSVDGSAPVRTGAYELMRRAGITMTYPDIGPGSWDGRRVLFSDRRFLWSIDVDARTGLASDIVQRLTFGTGRDSAPVASVGGTVAFLSSTSSNNVWSVPLDDDRGVALGPPRALTEGGGFYTRPSASRDGRWLAYHAALPRPSVFVKDTTTGAVTDLGVAGSNFGPAISPDGALVANEVGAGVVVSPARGGATRTLCTPCNIGDWTADGRALAVVLPVRPSRIALVSMADGRQRDLLTSDRQLSRPHFSSDGRFVAFRVSQDSETSLMMVARIPAEGAIKEPDWISVGGAERDLRPCGWSSSRSLLYFLSSRDGSRCLYVQPIDESSGNPRGEPTAVRHSHGGRNAWVGQSGVISTGPANAVRAGSFLYDLPSLSGSIWTLTAK